MKIDNMVFVSGVCNNMIFISNVCNINANGAHLSQALIEALFYEVKIEPNDIIQIFYGNYAYTKLLQYLPIETESTIYILKHNSCDHDGFTENTIPVCYKKNVPLDVLLLTKNETIVAGIKHIDQ